MTTYLDNILSVSATTNTTAAFTQPAIGATVSALVRTTAALVVGGYTFVAGGGTYLVSAIPDGTHATLVNMGSAGNAAPASSVPINALVAPAGAPGSQGAGQFRFTATAAPAVAAVRFPTQGSLYGTTAISGSQLVTKAFVATYFAFLCTGTALATDTVDCTVRLNGANAGSSTAFFATFTVPAGTAPGTLITATGFATAFAIGDLMSIACLQSSTTAQAAWNAAWYVS